MNSQTASIRIPRELSLDNLNEPYRRIITALQKGQRQFQLDFSSLRWAEPGGVTGLACIIEGLKNNHIQFTFAGASETNSAVKYLDESGFFIDLFKTPLVPVAAPRKTMIPFTRLSGSQHINYLYMRLQPWIEMEVQLSPDTMEALCTNISEALQNVEHHGSSCGFAMAQHYPKRSELCIAVADIGKGIPHHVRTVHKGIDDARALVRACERGFTTKSNYTNRGFGLDNLIRYAVHNNGGVVTLRSLQGKLYARPGKDMPELQGINTDWTYPGTCVHIILRTDTLERSEDIVRPEVFTW